MLHVLGAALLSAAPAPPSAPPPDTAAPPAYRHHLGLTASPMLRELFRPTGTTPIGQLFRETGTLPVGLLYKYQARPTLAWRLGAVLYRRTWQRLGAVPLANGQFTTRYTRLELAGGVEKTRAFSKRWLGYVGLEAGGRYERDHLQQDIVRDFVIDGQTVPALEQNITREKTRTVFVRPLVGLRCQLFSNVYLSAEATVAVQYAASIRNGLPSTARRLDNQELLWQSGVGEFKENGWDIALRPIQQLTLLYQFGQVTPATNLNR